MNLKIKSNTNLQLMAMAEQVRLLDIKALTVNGFGYLAIIGLPFLKSQRTYW